MGRLETTAGRGAAGTGVTMSHVWSVTGRATWIRSGDRWLYAWVHGPTAGVSRGAVILVSSIAREQVIGFRAVRMLALDLARSGFVVVRPDLTGVGEASQLDPSLDLCDTWVEDIDSCVVFAREALGVPIVHGIGLRIGAGLLARSEAINGTRIYWEPISGKRWLRRQSVLRSVSVDIPTTGKAGEVEVPGALYSPAHAASLRGLRAPAGNGNSEIVYMEPDPDDAIRLHSTVTLFARVPRESVRHLASLLPAGDEVLINPSWEPLTSVVVKDPVTGTQCRESIVTVGPHRLPGVISAPVAGASSPKTLGSVVFASGSAEPKDGPTALWVHIGRQAAAQGHHCLRVERRGSGNLGAPDALMDPSPYIPSAVEDFVDAGHFMRRRYGRPVIGVGFCSGSWVMMRAASRRAYDTVIGIAQGAWRRGARYYQRMEAETLIALSDTPLPDVEQQQGGTDSVEDAPSRSVRMKVWLRKHLPYAVWREIGRFDRATCAEHLIREAGAHADIILLFGDRDRDLFHYERGDESLARLRADKIHVETESLGPLDHALLAHSGRVKVINQVLHRLGSGASAAVTTRP